MDAKAPRYFLDSNIWIYALADNQEASKHSIARQLIVPESVVVSTQVVNEVCTNLIRKSEFKEDQIRSLVQAFYEGFDVVSFSLDIINSASNLRERYALSFWDSLIVSSALSSQTDILYSEDMQDDLIVAERLRIVNPFKSVP